MSPTSSSPPRSRRPSSRSARALMLAGVAAALVGSGAMVWQASYSAFSATTANPTNNWSTGTVVLADDDSGSALFTVSNLKPGDTGSKCIVVTSTGSLPSAVKMYTTASSFAQTNAVADNITLAVTRGTIASPPGGGACTGFVSDAVTTTGTMTAFSSTYTSYANGFGSWTTTGVGSESKVYRIDYTFSGAATNTQQGGSAAIGFTWEAQNS